MHLKIKFVNSDVLKHEVKSRSNLHTLRIFYRVGWSGILGLILIWAFPVSNCNKIVFFRILHPLAVWDSIKTILRGFAFIASIPTTTIFTTAMIPPFVRWTRAVSANVLWSNQQSFNYTTFWFEYTTTMFSWIRKCLYFIFVIF